MVEDLDYRKEVARELLSDGIEAADLVNKPDPAMLDFLPD
jgi:hypothetical protein